MGNRMNSYACFPSDVEKPLEDSSLYNYDIDDFDHQDIGKIAFRLLYKSH